MNSAMTNRLIVMSRALGFAKGRARSDYKPTDGDLARHGFCTKTENLFEIRLTREHTVAQASHQRTRLLQRIKIFATTNIDMLYNM